MPNVVMQMTSAAVDPPVDPLLEAAGFELVPCADGQTFLEAVMLRHPDAVVYALHADCREDLGVLRLMRRAAPAVPLVLLAADGSLETRKVTQTLRPTYYAVSPIDGAELCDVLKTALRRRGGHAG